MLHSKIDKEYRISTLHVYNWMMSNYRKLVEREYKKSKSVKPIFGWLADNLGESFFDLDLDNKRIEICFTFTKITTGLTVVEV